MSDNIDNLLQSAIEGEPHAFTNAFEIAISEKLRDRVEQMRADVANKFAGVGEE